MIPPCSVSFSPSKLGVITDLYTVYDGFRGVMSGWVAVSGCRELTPTSAVSRALPTFASTSTDSEDDAGKFAHQNTPIICTS